MNGDFCRNVTEALKCRFQRHVYGIMTYARSYARGKPSKNGNNSDINFEKSITNDYLRSTRRQDDIPLNIPYLSRAFFAATASRGRFKWH